MRPFLFILFLLTAFTINTTYSKTISQCAPIYPRMGDSNTDCSINLDDAIALQHMAWTHEAASTYPQMDLDQSGTIDNTDILIMQMYLAGRTPHLPVLDGSINASLVTTKWGDCNMDGIVNVSDLSFLANALAGNITPTPAQKASCDVSWSGNLTVQDLSVLANWLAGNISVLPLIPPS